MKIVGQHRLIRIFPFYIYQVKEQDVYHDMVHSYCTEIDTVWKTVKTFLVFKRK